MLTLSLLEKLTNPGDRLSWIKRWLIDEVWSLPHYQVLHSEYLEKGEDAVNKFETLIAASADRVYYEMLSVKEQDKSLLDVLSNKDTAVVVFDGLSIRELPIIQKLAEKSGFKVHSIDCAQAAVPCETLDYIQRELPCGRIGPSQLQARKELRTLCNFLNSSISFTDKSTPTFFNLPTRVLKSTVCASSFISTSGRV